LVKTIKPRQTSPQEHIVNLRKKMGYINAQLIKARADAVGAAEDSTRHGIAGINPVETRCRACLGLRDTIPHRIWICTRTGTKPARDALKKRLNQLSNRAQQNWLQAHTTEEQTVFLWRLEDPEATRLGLAVLTATIQEEQGR
jgi:hypothetical protein